MYEGCGAGALEAPRGVMMRGLSPGWGREKKRRLDGELAGLARLRG